jgi:hypothetical protein
VHLAEGWSKEPKWNVLEIPFFRASQIVLRELRDKAAEAETADSAGKPKPRAAKSLRQVTEETDEQRSQRRKAYVDPVLRHLGWTYSRLVIEACNRSNGPVYGYFDGSREKLQKRNHEDIEAAIRSGLKENPLYPDFKFVLPD